MVYAGEGRQGVPVPKPIHVPYPVRLILLPFPLGARRPRTREITIPFTSPLSTTVPYPTLLTSPPLPTPLGPLPLPLPLVRRCLGFCGSTWWRWQ